MRADLDKIIVALCGANPRDTFCPVVEVRTKRGWNRGYRTFGVSFGAVFCCVGAVVRVLKLGWPGFMGGQKVCLGSGFFVVVPRDKSV